MNKLPVIESAREINLLETEIEYFKDNLKHQITRKFLDNDFLSNEIIKIQEFLVKIVTLRDNTQHNIETFRVRYNGQLNGMIVDLVDVLTDLYSRLKVIGIYRPSPPRSRSRSRQRRRKNRKRVTQ